jgi:hypothetical protein
MLVLALLLTSCNPGFEFNKGDLTPDQMLDRATHIFIGVIEKHALEFRPFFRIPGDESGFWKVARRRVRIENVLRGEEKRPVVDIYEIFWTGGATGLWNVTTDDGRYLFLVRVENGKYHVVRDWRYSIFPIHSGRHERLPLDNSRPFWERFALLMWWVQPDLKLACGPYDNPGNALSEWRKVKIWRGLLYHTDRRL